MTYYIEDCAVTAQKDNKSVYVASNVHSAGDGSNTTLRYSKAVHRKISVKQPDVIKAYNSIKCLRKLVCSGWILLNRDTFTNALTFKRKQNRTLYTEGE